MGGPRRPSPPAAAAPVMYKCVSCEKSLPWHMGAPTEDDDGLWTCNTCLEMMQCYERKIVSRRDGGEEDPAIDLDAAAPTLEQMQRQLKAPIRRSDLRSWIYDGEDLAREMHTAAAASQAAQAASADRKGKLKRLAETVKTKKHPAPPAAATGAVVTDEEDVEDGVPRRKLESLGGPLPILPMSMRLDEFNSIKNKPWRDRIPPCQTCIDKRVRVANTAVCLGSCGHFIGCIECCTAGDAFIDKLRCPARDCYATVEFVVVVRNAIN